MSGVNFVDLLALLIIGIAVYFGWRSGFVIQAFALIGFVVGIGLVVLLAPLAASPLTNVDPWLRTVIVIASIAGVVLVAQALGSSIGAAIRRRIGRGILGGVDQGAGAAFGLIRGIFLVWLMGGLLSVLPMASFAAEARQSTILRALETRLPSPVVLAAQLGRVLQSTGLPDVFVGAPPATDLPTGGPSEREAEQIAAVARPSTLRVEAVACTNFVSGTAFAIAADHFVTNAHVVAGANQVWLSFDGALDRYPAHVVLFDPELDVALLVVDRPLPVEPLQLSADVPSRGEDAAVLGYTGGGGLRLIPALISRPIEAFGRDIYGSQIITRQVIEMSADVAPGDSGGPVVLPDRTVGGVTFSESRDQPNVGYALSPIDVARDVAKAETSSTPVSTGSCISLS